MAICEVTVFILFFHLFSNSSDSGVYIVLLHFLISHSRHSPEWTKLHTYFHIVRSTAFQFSFLLPPPILTEGMLRTTTIPLFCYTSLPLLPGRYTLTFKVRVHVILPSYLSSSLPSQILSPLKLPIKSYLQYCDKSRNGTSSGKGPLIPAPGQSLRAIPSPG